ncbi:MAG: Ig domain-containing protein [Ruminococcus sp.]|nr:Ig domain-containing protein [Ruminococcus sp.]
MDAKTGVISGTPTAIYPDGFESVVTVIAGNGDTAELPITFIISIGTVDVTETNADEIYYDGDAVPDVDDVLSADVAGTFEWVDVADDATLSTGENELQWKFTPDDTDNYGVVTGTTVITANANVAVATFTTTLIAEYGEEVSKDMSEYVYNADKVDGVMFTVDALPRGLTLDGETGIISGTPTAVYADGFDSVITVTAGNDSSATMNVEIVISKISADVTVSDAVYDNYHDGDAVPNVDDILSSDVEGTFEWVDADDTLSTGDNDLNWKFTPSDTDHYATVTGTITITADAVVALATDTLELDGTYDKPFEADLSECVENAEAVGGVTYSADQLPEGLTLDEETGIISGTPTAAYPDGFETVITITAGNGDIAELPVTFTIAKGTATVTVSDDVENGDYTEGDAIPDVDDILSADVEGTFEWTTDQDELDASENDLT